MREGRWMMGTKRSKKDEWKRNNEEEKEGKQEEGEKEETKKNDTKYEEDKDGREFNQKIGQRGRREWMMMVMEKKNEVV